MSEQIWGRKPLSIKQAIPLRLGAWFMERFPLIHAFSGVLLFIMLYTFAAKVHALPTRFSYLEIAGALSVVFEFLFLRVLDEHKDYRVDLINHPQRVLQKGLVSLTHLKWIGLLALGFQLALAFHVDRGLGNSTVALVLMVAYSLLMFKEFFVAEWLKKHILLYTGSHVLIVPFIANWIYSLCFASNVWNKSLAISVVLATISGFVYDVVRKMRGQEEEKPTLDSTSRDFGSGKAAKISAIILVVTYICYVATVASIGGGVGAFTVSAVIALLCLASFKKYLNRPTAKTRKANEAILGLLLLVNYIVIILISVN